jgi:nitrogen fixation NifU-like protein
MQLQSMYQEIILDHYRNPHGRGLREPYEAEVHHVNPTCGDEVTLRVHLDGDTIADVSYEGMGCSIAFAGVSKYPARIKCALMSWMALKDASARAWGGQA